MTVHGTMRTTPYELVFGQPPRQNLFPGAKGTDILEDVEDLFSEGGDSGAENKKSGSSDEESGVRSEKSDSSDEESGVRSKKGINKDEDRQGTTQKHRVLRKEADKCAKEMPKQCS